MKNGICYLRGEADYSLSGNISGTIATLPVSPATTSYFGLVGGSTQMHKIYVSTTGILGVSVAGGDGYVMLFGVSFPVD